MSDVKMCTCGPDGQSSIIPVREDGEMRIYCSVCDGVWGRTSLEKWNTFPPDQPVRIDSFENRELVYGPVPTPVAEGAH
jgi:hypothetical protein